MPDFYGATVPEGWEVETHYGVALCGVIQWGLCSGWKRLRVYDKGLLVLSTAKGYYEIQCKSVADAFELGEAIRKAVKE